MTERLLTEMNTQSKPQKGSTVFILLSVRDGPEANRTKKAYGIKLNQGWRKWNEL